MSTILVTAPPGRGKTTAILNFYKNFEFQKIIFYSPLRSIANEVYDRACDQKNVYLFKCSDDFKNLKDIVNKDRFFIITTPELLSADQIDSEDVLIILDEVHLFFYWGETFRNTLMEFLYEIFEKSCLKIFLTATLDLKLMDKMNSYRRYGSDDQLTWLDYGNQKLGHHPRNQYLYTKKQDVIFQLFVELKLKNKTRNLVFVKSIKEAKELYYFLKRQKMKVTICFSGYLDEIPTFHEVDCIIATSVLSHGVNLPEINNVFITYPINNKDFWIQMVGRGGRRGEKFNVISCDNYLIKKNKQWPMLLKSQIYKYYQGFKLRLIT